MKRLKVNGLEGAMLRLKNALATRTTLVMLRATPELQQAVVPGTLENTRNRVEPFELSP